MSGESLHEQHKQKDVRMSNIIAAKAVADAVRTSLGPRGMDKMIQGTDGEVVISNDGATIVSHMELSHPCAKMLVDLSKSQDIVAGDGTTSVVVVAGALLQATQQLLDKGIHPTIITEAFQNAAIKAESILESISTPVNMDDRTDLINCVTTCLSSKVVSQNSSKLAPIAVDSVLAVMESPDSSVVDLADIKVVQQVGGTIDDTEMVNGMVFDKGASKAAGGPTSIKNAKIGLIQFQLSMPKTDMDNNVVVSDYAAMDRLLREERKYLLQMCKKIKKSGCNVLLIQKSILRDAVNDLSLHFLAKLGIMVIRDVERTDVDFICRTLGCRPVAHIDNFTAEKLGQAGIAEEVSAGVKGSAVVKITDVVQQGTMLGKTMTILVRGSNKLVVEEADRSLHDALCVMRSLVKKRFLICGGAVPEVETARQLQIWAKELKGQHSFCTKLFAEAFEVVPLTLAENAGLNPIAITTELRRRHKAGEMNAGINVRLGKISDMRAENVVQPLLVSTSVISLSTECIRMILKIDDIVAVR